MAVQKVRSVVYDTCAYLAYSITREKNTKSTKMTCSSSTIYNMWICARSVVVRQCCVCFRVVCLCVKCISISIYVYKHFICVSIINRSNRRQCIGIWAHTLFRNNHVCVCRFLWSKRQMITYDERERNKNLLTVRHLECATRISTLHTLN